MALAVGKPGDSRSPGTGRKIAVAPSSAPCGGFSPHAAFPRLTPWVTFLRPSGWLPSGEQVRVEISSRLLPAALSLGRRQGRKTPHNSCRVACWKWSAFYAIAVLLELLDHSGNARALRFVAHRRTPFLVADPLMQNHPEQSVKSVGDRPDGLFVS